MFLALPGVSVLVVVAAVCLWLLSPPLRMFESPCRLLVSLLEDHWLNPKVLVLLSVDAMCLFCGLSLLCACPAVCRCYVFVLRSCGLSLLCVCSAENVAELLVALSGRVIRRIVPA